MGKKMTRVIAGLLFACMIAGSIPANAVYGNDANVDNEQSQDQNLSENEQNIGSTDGGEDSVFENGEIQGQLDENDTVSAAESPKVIVDDETAVGDETIQTDESESAGDAEAGEINFVYVESPYLETPGTQRIVFAFDQVLSKADKITLTVKDDAGNQEEWDLSRQTDHLYLFEKEYTGDAYSGTYQAVSLNLYGEKAENIILEEAGVKAEFGVNEEYDGIEELQPIEATAEETSGIEASVVTIDEDGVAEAQDSIADALNTVSAQAASANGISTFSADTTSRSGNIVVALDPGHDAWDAGARGNGLAEEELTLKIANYCKEELEQYSGVTVYMTRIGPECPHGIWGVGCIPERVEAAAVAGAQIFVSFHLNAATSSSANGAEVIVPNESWQAEVGQEGRELGEAILDELVSLGLTRRSVYSKDTTIGETYPDGSISDYFGVQIYCKEAGIPGLIVEHAFISNSGDANKFLKTEAGLKSLGVADATGIAKYLGLSKGYWDGDYYYENGQKVYGTKKIGDSWYYFDPEKNGAKHTGFLSINGYTYYYRSDGGLVLGTEKINGDWYYFNPDLGGGMQKGFVTVDGSTYYYEQDGKLVLGTYKIGNDWYYFNPDLGGGMQKGFVTVDESTYYYDQDGKLVLGTYKIGNDWYYFNPDLSGGMQKGFVTVDESTYYYDQDGKLVLGTRKIEDDWYYFNPDLGGGMQKGFVTVDGSTYYYDQDGKLVLGRCEIGEDEYYFNPDLGGGMQIGFLTIHGSTYTYYYDQDGKLVLGTCKIEDDWYYFNPDLGGGMQKGFVTVDGSTYYYDQDGKLVLGTCKIEDDWYYFNPDLGGNMQKGFLTIDGSTYYYQQNGQLVFGRYEIDGIWYNFDLNTGALLQEYYTIMGSTQATIEQMVSYYNSKNKVYPSGVLSKGGASTIREFCNILVEEAKIEGVRAEVLFCQAMKETGWLQFGGIVKVEQYNFGGLGATDVNGAANSAWFKDVRTGLRAQVQHLKAYGSNEELKQQCVDPRFNLVKRNSAPYVQWLGQKENPNGYGWATAANYGYDIVDSINELLKF